jgi:hypothetical protein
LGELVAVDTHLGNCGACKASLAALADTTPSKSVISGIDQARFRHLSYEQMEDWVEDTIEPADREYVMAHIGTCKACARQLIAYQEYAPVMAAPIRTAMHRATAPVAVEEKKSFWSFLRQPEYALGAAALIALFVISAPWNRHSPVEEMGAIVAPTSTAVESTIPAHDNALIDTAMSAKELDALPDSLRIGAKEMISKPESVERPASLKGLEGNGDTTLEYPYAEVVPETQPVMRWKAFGDTYSVSLFDAHHGLLSRRGNLKDTRWTPPTALVRNQVYSWEVESAGVKHRGTFRILGAAQQQELAKVRAEHGTSHLVMGAVAEQFGLLTEARGEFEAMAKDSAQAQQAAKLLSRIDALKK